MSLISVARCSSASLRSDSHSSAPTAMRKRTKARRGSHHSQRLEPAGVVRRSAEMSAGIAAGGMVERSMGG